MKKSFIAALALSVSLSFAAGAAAAAEQTLAQKHQGMWPKSENGFVTKNQLVALVTFVVCALAGVFVWRDIFVVVAAYSLSGVVEIVYCKYLIRKYRLYA